MNSLRLVIKYKLTGTYHIFFADFQTIMPQEFLNMALERFNFNRSTNNWNDTVISCLPLTFACNAIFYIYHSTTLIWDMKHLETHVICITFVTCKYMYPEGLKRRHPWLINIDNFIFSPANCFFWRTFNRYFQQFLHLTRRIQSHRVFISLLCRSSLFLTSLLPRYLYKISLCIFFFNILQ